MPRPEQTEKPTPKRRSEARDRGQVARSHDVSGACIFLAAVFVIHFSFAPGLNAAAATMQIAIMHIYSTQTLNVYSVWGLFMRAMMPFTLIMALFLGLTFLIAIVSNVAQVGFMFTTHPLKPNFSRLNPLGGLRSLFVSPQTLVNLGKQLLKLGAVFVLVYTILRANFNDVFATAQMSIVGLLALVNNLLYDITWRFGVLLLILGLIDYAYEKYRLEQSLKMSKEEIKEEAKASEGSQEAKSAIKKRQREFYRKRMMAAVPKATVVVTNPTHFAVALEWDELTMEAPVLTAKGADLLARRIRELAKEHGVPIMENPPLARALYERVDLDTPIPPNLYAAVAQVIAFVYKLKTKTPA